MNIPELLTLAADAEFRGRLKFVLYRKAVAVRKDPAATVSAKAVAKNILDDLAPLERLALATVTEAAFATAADYAAIDDAQLEASAISAILAFM